MNQTPDPYLISVHADSTFMDAESDEDTGRFVFAYTVTIRNEGTVPAQLLSRHWLVTDADGKVQEVKGDGVVGEQPLLKPGRSFQYTSAALIETPRGTMHGTYQMRADDGTEFNAEIPVFSLSVPGLTLN